MMNPLSPVTRRRALVRSIYRKLFRESNRIPENSSLVHLDQWIDNTRIKDQHTLRSCLRTSFRLRSMTNTKRDDDNTNQGGKGIQRAMEGLKYLIYLDPNNLKTIPSEKDEEDLHQKASPHFPLLSALRSTELLESVEWLPHLSEIEDTRVNSYSSVFPIFPLSGPLFPDKAGKRLPLISGFSEMPVAGTEISLQIFEPRYRQMYQDLISSTSTGTNKLSKSFIVPFSHPHIPGKFASFGWIYEIIRVHDVADETNGKFQLVCNHAVTKPVKIHCIINPSNYETKLTYLRAHADIIHYNEDNVRGEEEQQQQQQKVHTGIPESTTSTAIKNLPCNMKAREDLQTLKELLLQLQKSPSLSSDNNNDTIERSLINRLLEASRESSIWPVVQVWISGLQMEILQLQIKISSRIQLQAVERQKRTTTIPNDNRQVQESVTENMILLAQEPYYFHLKSMLIEVATLIPSLLQEESHRDQCELMCKRIRDRLMRSTKPE
mmetsp:Transcript_24597/g.26473  ORF Transcript_24597/g.26473 Transcript_24597/m.26473 type:complete len:493 (+) Transcript_24597:89-1567(+)